VGVVLTEFALANRKIKDRRQYGEASSDATAQVQRLCSKWFVMSTPWTRLQQVPRYLKAVVMRLDKITTDPARDAERLAQLRPLEQRYWRLLSERKGVQDDRMDDYRWLLEELRVSLFAQELRTPQPVSAKRLDKAWAQLAD
jgi:ATP-dependent helicase HrpA